MDEKAEHATYAQRAVDVAGYCPMGCGRTLFVGEGGHVTCSVLDCPAPGAVDDLLHQWREQEHLLEVRENGWTMSHPIRERVDGSLFDCVVDLDIREAIDTLEPGRYRVRRQQPDPVSESRRSDDCGYTFESIEATA